MIDHIYLKNFTVFRELDLPVVPGINVVIGDNGTGKTHLLKAAYGVLVSESNYAGSISKTFFDYEDIEKKLIADFLPKEQKINRLVRAKVVDVGEKAEIKIKRGEFLFGIEFPNKIVFGKHWTSVENEKFSRGKPVIYIPEKEMLANALGFVSLYSLRQISFEGIYADIILQAGLDPLRKLDESQTQLLEKIQNIIGGVVVEEGGAFYLETSEAKYEFSLVATGMRKFGLLWLLIRNGSSGDGATLFWDEPEANLNPSMLAALVDILLELQRNGVQIFLATHNYVLLKLLELKKEQEDSLQFISFSKNAETKDIDVQLGAHYTDILPNKIADAHSAIYDMQVQKSLGGVF